MRWRSQRRSGCVMGSKRWRREWKLIKVWWHDTSLELACSRSRGAHGTQRGWWYFISLLAHAFVIHNHTSRVTMAAPIHQRHCSSSSRTLHQFTSSLRPHFSCCLAGPAAIEWQKHKDEYLQRPHTHNIDICKWHFSSFYVLLIQIIRQWWCFSSLLIAAIFTSRCFSIMSWCGGEELNKSGRVSLWSSFRTI